MEFSPDKFAHLSDVELFELISDSKNLDDSEYRAINEELGRRRLLNNSVPELTKSSSLVAATTPRTLNIESIISAVTRLFQWYALKTDKAINVLTVFLSLVFIFRSFHEFAWIRFLIIESEWIRDPKMFAYVSIYALLPVATLIFFIRKTTGWVMVMIYVYFNILEITWSLYTYWNHELDITVGSIDALIPFQNSIQAMISGILFFSMALMLTRGDIREKFFISRKSMFTIMFLTALSYVVIEFLGKFFN